MCQAKRISRGRTSMQRHEDQRPAEEHVQSQQLDTHRPHGQLQAHRDRLGHHQQPGLRRVVAEAHLLQQRQQKRDAADRNAREEAAGNRGAGGAQVEQAQLQQRIAGARGVPAVAAQQQRRQCQQPDDRQAFQAVLAEYLERIRQQRDAGAEQQQSGDVQRRRSRLAKIGLADVPASWESGGL